MAYTNLTRTIAAPASVVFRAVADVEHYARAVDGIEKVEFLTPLHSGVGAKYRTTRVVKGKPYVMDFAITEWVADQRVRIVNEFHGTVWDSTFTVRPRAGDCELSLVMEATSRRLLPRIMVALIRPMVNRSVGRDLDAVKKYCEANANAPRS